MDEETRQKLRTYRVPDDKRAGMTPEEIARVEAAMRAWGNASGPPPISPQKWEDFDHPDLHDEGDKK